MSKRNLLVFSLFLLFTHVPSHNVGLHSGEDKMNPVNETESNEYSEAMSPIDVDYKILITHREVPEEALDLLKPCKVIICESLPPNRTEILEKAKGVHAMFWGSHEPLNAEVLDTAGPQLKAISTMSAGIDYVDIEELKKRKIPLGHTPIVLNNAVADLAMALMLAAARRLHEGRLKIENSAWENYHIKWMWGQDIHESTVGFFGFGGIGQTIAKRLKGFDIDEILYTTRKPISKSLEKQYNARKVPLNDLLSQSDILFIAAPLTAETKHVFNATAFAKMKQNAVLVNIARGGIVNYDDLYDALKSNTIFAAGVDVIDPEPLPAHHKLLSLPNFVISPHIGSATERTRIEMSIIAAHNILRGLTGEPMLSPAY